MRAGRDCAGRARRAVDEALARLEEQRRPAARRSRRPAARVRAQRRARLDAGDDGHGPEPRAQRRGGRGAGRAHRQRAVRVGLLPPARADVRRRRARRARACASRRRSRASSASAASTLDTELDADALRELTRRFQALYDFPADPREQLDQAIARGVRLVDGRARRRVPAHQRHPRRLGHRGQRPADGVRQQGADARARASRSSRDEVTGAPEPSGDFLVDAQGEDVVSGVRTPRDLLELGDWMPDGARRSCCEILRDAGAPLQGHAGHRVHGRGGAPVHAADAQRQAPRAGGGALRRRRRRRGPADAGGGDRDDRRGRAGRAAASDVRRPARDTTCVARGVAASPGAAKGEIVFTAAGGGRRRRGRARR